MSHVLDQSSLLLGRCRLRRRPSEKALAPALPTPHSFLFTLSRASFQRALSHEASTKMPANQQVLLATMVFSLCTCAPVHLCTPLLSMSSRGGLKIEWPRYVPRYPICASASSPCSFLHLHPSTPEPSPRVAQMQLSSTTARLSSTAQHANINTLGTHQATFSPFNSSDSKLPTTSLPPHLFSFFWSSLAFTLFYLFDHRLHGCAFRPVHPSIFLVLVAVMEMITPTLGASVLGDTSSPHIPYTGSGSPQTGRGSG